MEAPIIDDELWTLIEPLLPPPKPRRKGHPGRPRVSDRAALNGILFVLKTGLRWNHLPTVLGFGSGATCWRRLNDWRKAGVWDRLHELLLDKLREAGQIDLSYAAVDSSSVRAVGAGGKTGPNPTDRSRPGSKHHILVDANGVPISAILTGANRNDVTQLLPLVDAIPPIRGARGRPLQRPKVIYADRGYDSDPHRQRLRERGIKPVIARRRTEHGSGLGKFRWVVERTHSWLHNFRRLRIRFDRRADIHEAFLKFGCALVCWNIFRRTEQPF
ncbi:IS5-like element ISRme6 family transposase [Burkholderia cenocepacia]|uniref:IS5-like element ISRme6 family transposase n=1 Tax=Burkholderiaceae TaxID=119060 RepID=UPI000A2EF9A7|nr:MULTISPECIES: IS5-like element ISRme6 family transposase [Burkholderiaceae]MBK5124317.1 IS5-like element ISRme6 family transposase [Burkholderia sp. R-69980]MBJ9658114.1 IS5-like element ISRme6 family transposase [Burkholderia multivorans]MBR8028341.1 IS5-like element ISRme6 family transposase [Burkholderia cenocepacia]MBR8049193.1 IS5-like element ISRme6 family transposase [Burkholderia multivorans]MBR8171146.1 IS5-like element ISRme6 family transposase [Burkholderia cenocepacia]